MKCIRRSLLFALCLLLCAGCNSARHSDDIVILYTNDIHCTVDVPHFGFAEFSAYKQKMLRRTPYVLTVDSGDAIQGAAVGTITKGAAVIDVMNAVGYDFITFGNHEFDYGLENLAALVDRSVAQYVCSTISYSGEAPSFMDKTFPFALRQCGSTRVAFIGAVTPDVTKLASFDEAERAEYDFSSGDDGRALLQRVQAAADECRQAGADYVVLLAHLGAVDGAYSSYAVAAGTDGIDLIIDGHSHSIIRDDVVKNKSGGDVHITSSGSHFRNFGAVTISPSGAVSVVLVPEFAERDGRVLSVLEDIARDARNALGTIVARSNARVPLLGADGTRILLRQETALGDLCADAFRTVGGSDIAIINGAAIRAELPKGDISYGDMLSVFPFDNALCVVRATGQQILDALEWSCRALPGAANGFLQVSGISFSVDTHIPSPVVTDDGGSFVRSEGARRVQDVKILRNGSWERIDAQELYTVASTSFVLAAGGDNFTMFRGCDVVIAHGESDCAVLTAYLNDVLHGDVRSRYENPAGRITIVKNP